MPYSCSGDMRRAAGWVPHPPLWTAWCTRGPVDGYGYALDASTGELRWLRDGLQSNPLHPPLGTAWCTWGPRATTSMPCMLAIAEPWPSFIGVELT